MVKDQYIIPGSQNESTPLEAALHFADAAQYTPEVQPVVFHALKEVEQKIDMYRETAIEMGEGRRALWSRAIQPFVLNTRSHEDQLIERESFIGGSLYPSLPEARFWLHKRHEGDAPGVRNWLFSYMNVEAKQRVDIVYQTTPQSIHKLYAGIERPFSPEEQRNFLYATEQYRRKVLRELYPLDDSLEELQDQRDHAA